MKNSVTIIFCFLLINQSLVFAQNDINNYKYVSVSERFDFLKYADQYQVNSLTKFLLKKNGFVVLEGSDNYPKDLSENRCLLLNVDVLKLKGFLKTKLEVQFRDCNNELIFKSSIGSSKEKDYKKSYHEALRAAFESVAALNYNYVIQVPETSAASIPVPTPSDVPQPPVIPTAVEVVPTPPVPENSSVAPTVTEQEIPQIQVNATAYGFEVKDVVSGAVLHALHATIYDGIFLIDNKPGIAYKRGNRWVREYIANQKIVIEPLF
ncbi:MAG: hypothetical protein P8H23_07000 [Flavobacteriaceae bacterium]|nr:hypothetical protein [Flavobacteriaceae bacterium]